MSRALEQAEPPAPVSAPARATLPVGATAPERLLALQRVAGNAAVTRALGRRPPGRLLARCGAACDCDDCAGEHAPVAGLLRDAVLARRTARVASASRRGLQRGPLRGEDPPPPPVPAPAPAPSPEAGPPDAGPDAAPLEPDNPSNEQDPSKVIGVCGPDVTRQLAGTLAQMETDFKSWSEPDQRRACMRVVIPFDINKILTGPKGSGVDLNGWDIHALFLGEGHWLRRRPVCPPCATPSSSAGASATWSDKGHEDPRTCSDTVQVGDACWLAGTPNYATFGMILRLCGGQFPGDTDMWSGTPLEHGQALIRLYKLMGKESPKYPLAWTEAVYKGGATATVGGGNRQSCTTTCSQVNPKLDPSKLANWDYVWEPVHPRLKIAPAPAPATP